MPRTKKKETPVSEIITRLENEFNEVAGRVERLTTALNKGKEFIKKVGAEQYDLSCDQQSCMLQYRNILAIRISLLKRKEGGK